MKEMDRIDAILRANERLIQINNELVKVNEGWQEVVIKLLAMLKEVKEKGRCDESESKHHKSD